MSRDPQRLADYLAHIAEAIGRIDRYTANLDESTFLNDQLVQDAVVRNLEILGEASNNIERHCPEFAAQHPELPLAFAYQMRNALATAISRWTSRSSGRRSMATFPAFWRGSKMHRPACPLLEIS